MNIMVVDDEYSIRSHLASMLQGLDGDGVTIREAVNGKDALRLMEQSPSEIVLTDIRMPVMDGMELIRQCRMKHPGIWFIVLSNFAEFELAQKALEYGARNYLLKATITQDKVLEEVQRAILHLEKSKEKEVKFNPNEFLMVQNSLFYERLQGHIQNIELLRRAERLKVSVFLEAFDLPSKFAIMEIERFSDWTGNKFRGQSDLAVYALINVVRESIKQWNESNELFHMGENRFVVLDLGERDDERHIRKIVDISEVTQKYLGLEASFLTNCNFSDMSDFFWRVQESRHQLAHFFYEMNACMINAMQVQPPETDLDLFTFFQSVEGGEEGRLQVTALPGLVDTYFELLRHLRRPSLAAKGDVKTLIQFIENGGFAVPTALKSEIELLQASRLADFKAPFTHWLGVLGGNSRHREEISKALSFIHDRYATKISLEDICSHVNLSRSHLSKLFKDQQGLPVMEYMETYRLKQARMLLRTTKRPIAEIIDRVGIADVFYFSKLYKKHFGINPSKDR
ncbi:response regulator [Cohnella luojiensis]|uniref:Response regulator n=1 Tax=Cohnella luojiensis TaxID=652876 RepID=A0A4Y8M406_9BACL|nr:response regulator [Cohnella luojiensis]TFE26971.1 response regulator [Cohnella luojiensis]